LFNGWVQVIIQSTKQAGDIKLTVTSNGLKQAELTVPFRD
jgi:hypothetical protein